jgi:hypothetical protein
MEYPTNLFHQISWNIQQTSSIKFREISGEGKNEIFAFTRYFTKFDVLNSFGVGWGVRK